MARSKSSARWLREHNDDKYVRLAQAEGYRSRAVYKLQELDSKYTLFRPGMQVVDLGSAPGGWSQYAAHKVGHNGRVIASDILSMDSIAGVEFIQGDFQESVVLQAILDLLGERRADLVLSDMAPNMSGVDAVDIPRAMYLVELAHQLAAGILRKNGVFVSKMFQGQGSDAWLEMLRRDFSKVAIRKPVASRPRSREVYVLAFGFKNR
jgi:23S rRNA (uridine2552-2'-O)-methyltransferase